ncbi:LysR family transcriptional regulator [Mycolicibacterium sp.]|uniref:LysR family transcriptional regulator n=1 Tax=Mycolicibacterium sp. TaxID=2320850 RepID=UPI0037C50E9F
MVRYGFELRHLRAFAVLAEELHFGRAAERLFVTQPALTQTIRQLERGLGVDLFVRTTRAVALSPEGARLLPYVRVSTMAVDRVEVQAQRLTREQAGRLQVGYQVGAGLTLMATVVRDFEAAYPQFTVEFAEYDFSEPASGLDVGRTDVAFVRPPIGLEHIDVLTLYEEPRLACVPRGHRFAHRSSVSIAEVLAEPIIAAPTPGVWRDYWLLNEYRSEPANVVSESATFESELQAVAAGRGIIVTSEASKKYFNRPNVAYVDIEGLGPCDVAIAWPRDSVHPALQPFLSTLTQRMTTTGDL